MLIIDLSATQPTEAAKFHGGSEYAKAVFMKFIELGFLNFAAIYNEEYDLDKEIENVCIEKNISLISKKGKTSIINYINEVQPDVYYSALPYEQADINTKKTLFIMTIHGLREIECPSDSIELSYALNLKSKIKVLIKNTFFPNWNRNKYKKKFSKLLDKKNIRIITVSEHTKYSLCSVFPFIKNSDIFVSPAPCPFGLDNILKTDELKKIDLISKGFFLLVSGNRWLKNNFRALDALDQFYSKNSECKIKTIITGMSSVSVKLINKERFIFLDYLEKDSLDWLYANAYCFVYPSLNEGYGYPPVQAMYYGTPVLASSLSSIPEVCDNNVLYFDPKNVLEIENRVLRLYNERALYNELASKGKLHANKIKNAQEQNLKRVVEYIYYSSLHNN